MRYGMLALAAFALGTAPAGAAEPSKPLKCLIITGDIYPAHDWKATAPALKQVLMASGRFEVAITSTPAKDLTDANLAGYDLLVLHYLDYTKPSETPETVWSAANKAAFLKAIRDGGKGLVVVHHASGSFTKPNWVEFERAVGGWRTQGFHGPAHDFTVKKAPGSHPIAEGAPAEFAHATDELYQNSLLPAGSVVLATAYSDPGKPKGTGKDEAVIWASTYGKGRVFENVLGHDVAAITDPGVATWLRRGAIWAATGEVGPEVK